MKAMKFPSNQTIARVHRVSLILAVVLVPLGYLVDYSQNMQIVVRLVAGVALATVSFLFGYDRARRDVTGIVTDILTRERSR